MMWIKVSEPVIESSCFFWGVLLKHHEIERQRVVLGVHWKRKLFIPDMLLFLWSLTQIPILQDKEAHTSNYYLVGCTTRMKNNEVVYFKVVLDYAL